MRIDMDGSRLEIRKVPDYNKRDVDSVRRIVVSSGRGQRTRGIRARPGKELSSTESVDKRFVSAKYSYLDLREGVPPLEVLPCTYFCFFSAGLRI